jgi:PAS domain S-box-containing protein
MSGIHAIVINSRDVTERLQAEEVLHRERIFLKKVLDSAPGFICIKDKESRFRLANKALADAFNTTVDNLLGKNDDDINPQKDEVHQFHQDDLEVLTTKKEKYILEEKNTFANGEIHWLTTIRVPLIEEDGECNQLLSISTDITSRKRAEEALAQERNLLRTLIDHMPDAVYVKDINGRKTLANRADLYNMGIRTEAESIGKTDFDVYPPALAAKFSADDQIVMQTDQSLIDREEVISQRDGHQRWLSTSKIPLKDASGKIAGLVGIGHDITERKEAEEALRQANETLRATLETAPVAIFDMDLRGRVMSLWNSAAESMWGWRREEVLGQFPPFVPEENTEEYQQFLEWMQSGKAWNGIDARHQRKDGTQIDYSIYTAPLYDTANHVFGNIVVLVDITERKQAEEQIRQLNATLEQRVIERTAQLEAANKELEAFSYSVSHDLRAPLRSMDGFSQALLEDYGDNLDDQATKYLSRIRVACHRMSEIIDDLLKLSRVTRSEMRRESVSLSEMARTISAELQATQPERKMEWIITPGLSVNADPNLLHIMLSNLLGNAWKFTSKHPTAKVDVGVIKKDGKLVYYIRDDGAGFDIAFADKLFGAFQRLHAAHEFEGTGIGLATVQRIIHRHGGRVWAESVVEQGTTIYFTLP